jgi:hypothetical protein
MLFRLSAYVYLVAVCLMAQQQQSKRPANWPCVGGRAVDPSHVAVTEGTGGHLYMLDSSEIETTGRLMVWHQKHTETVFRAMGELSNGAREFAFPVDSMVESLVVTISLQCNSGVAILDATGGESAGERADFRAGRAIRISRPGSGNWKVRLKGRGLFFVTVEAFSELALDRARFVTPGGRPGHEGLFPVKTPPALGAAAMLWVSVSGRPRELRMRLVDSAAQTLDAPPLETLGGDDYLARLTMQHSGFRVVVEGIDERGWPFQRFDLPLLTAGEPSAAATPQTPDPQ